MRYLVAAVLLCLSCTEPPNQSNKCTETLIGPYPPRELWFDYASDTLTIGQDPSYDPGRIRWITFHSPSDEIYVGTNRFESLEDRISFVVEFYHPTDALKFWAVFSTTPRVMFNQLRYRKEKQSEQIQVFREALEMLRVIKIKASASIGDTTLVNY